jgi:hypothetical protein
MEKGIFMTPCIVQVIFCQRGVVGCIPNNIMGLLPEAIGLIPGALGDVATGKNIGEVKETLLVESYSHNLCR